MLNKFIYIRLVEPRTKRWKGDYTSGIKNVVVNNNIFWNPGPRDGGKILLVEQKKLGEPNTIGE